MKTRIFITTSNTDGAGALPTIAAPRAVSAHLQALPNIAAATSFAQIKFRVPTARVTATTTQAEVDMPAAMPVGKVSYRAESVTRAIRTGIGTGTEHRSPVQYTNDAPVAEHDEDAETSSADGSSGAEASSAGPARRLRISGLGIGSWGSGALRIGSPGSGALRIGSPGSGAAGVAPSVVTLRRTVTASR